MRTKKRFSVIFLILVLFASLMTFLVACDEEGGVEYPITKLVISTLPKTEYYLGDKFELENAQLTVYYENDTKETVDLTLNMISEFSTTSIGEQTLTIKYKEAVTYLTVNVISAPVYSLQVESIDHKTEYVVGESLDVTGLKLLVTYSNSFTSVIDVTADMVSGFSSESTGEKQLVISYGNRTCNMTIQVVRRSVMQMQLIAPKKLDYIVGDTIDLSEGQLFVSYNDNTSEYLNLVQLHKDGTLGIAIAGEDNTTFTKSQLSCVVTLYYADNTFSYAVVVEARKATSAAVTTDVKPQIFESVEPNFSDGVITVTYNNGDVEEKSFYDDGIELSLGQFDINRLGVYNIGINADGLYFEYKVEVISANPSELIIIPNSETYYQDETIDLSLWQYQIKLDNGKYNLISSTGAYYANVTENMLVGNVEDIDNFKVGKQSLEFTLTTTDNTVLTAVAEIEILEKEIVEAIITPPTKIVYSVGDVLDLNGAELVLVYNNGDTSDALAVTADMLTTGSGENADLASFTSTVQDVLTVYVNYVDDRYDTSFIASFDIKVTKKANYLELISQPKVHYVLGESFDSSDWEIIIHYSDDSTATINDFSGIEWTFENVDFNELGTRKVRLYYGTDVYLEYAITISNEISRIYTEKPFVGFVTEGKAISFGDMQLNVIRENGELTSMAISNDMADYVANKTFVSNSISFVPAYVDASILAKEDALNENWATEFSKYYVRNANGYVVATSVYSEDENYYFSVTDYYSENWLDVYYNFYVYDNQNSEYVRATEQYDSNVEYYLAADNVYDVNVTYLGKSIVLKVFVESKQIVAASIAGIGQRYIVSNSEWNLNDAELTINFNNNTSKVITGSELTAISGSAYSFINNGMEYVLNLGIFVDDNFVDFTLADLIARFQASQSQYQTENLVVRVTDYANDKKHYTESSSIYCFENLVKSIVAVVGDFDGDSVSAYQEQKVYVNAGLDLLDNAFVVANSSQRADFESHVYLCIAYENDSYEYVSIEDAINENGFAMNGYDTSKAGAQIVKIEYLLSECTLALEVRANVIDSLRIIEQSITVIEGVALTSGDVSIMATMVDADGQPISGEVAVDFLDVTSSYDHKQEIIFSDKDENGYYVVKEFTVNYGSIVSNVVELVIRKKSLTGVSMKDMPKQVYIEDSTGATEIDYTNGSIMLLYNNGTNKTISLTDASVKIDSSEFNANLELSGAGQQSQTIRISYTDENNVTHNTQYNVIIKDRKYLTLDFENLPYDKKYSYQYGTGESAGPRYLITYYQSFDGEGLNMSRGDGTNGTYELVYINNATGISQAEWPTEVGVYTLSISYEGDTINNEFYNDSVIVEIIRKEIVIKVSDHVLTYGDIFVGSTNADIGIEWEMKGLVNGVLTDNPYCYNDTSADVVDFVEFDIFNALGTEIVFGSLTVENVAKFVINANVGEYVVVPKITLKSANYFVSTNYINVNSKLIIEKRNLVVVSKDTSKIYGSNNPEFTYEVYDYEKIGNYLVNSGNIGDISELSEEKLQSINFTSIKNAQNGVLPLGNHNRLYYFFNENYSDLYDGENFNVTAQDVIYSDNAIAQYRLTRPISDNENVGEHVIYGGDGNILSNYTIYFVKGTLNIEKANLEIAGVDINRYYGTTQLSPEYLVAGNTSLKYFDSFDELFGDYFDVDEVIFYNKVTGKFTRQITDNYYDDWCVLYKNVRVYKDEECTEIAGYFLENTSFNIAGIIYEGSYTALPVDAEAGQYYVAIDFNNLDLFNYEVEQYDVDGKKYAFTISIQQVNVELNVESIIVAENENITDDNSRVLSSYFKFESNGLSVNNLSRTDLVNAEFIDEMFKDKILGVTYNAQDGKAIDYVLSSSYLNDSYAFYKTALNNLDAEKGEKVENLSRAGTYTIGIKTDSNNYAISLSSIFVEHNQSYVEFFHSVWGLRYEINSLDSATTLFSNDAYMIVLPTYANIAYGNGEENLHQEVYDKVEYVNWTLDTFIDTTGSEYVASEKQGISFVISNNDELMNSLSYMVAGDYSGVMTYSFFDREEINYLYLGDNVMLSDANAAQIINYLLLGTKGDVKYTEVFEYTVTPIILDATILGVETKSGSGESVSYEVKNQIYFDEEHKTLTVNFDGAKIFGDDNFNLTFDVEATYNTREEVIRSENVELSAYHHKFNGVYVNDDATINKAITAFKLLNAGTYKVKLVALGNMNYAIGNNAECVITILSINLPIYLTRDITDEDNEFTITRPYTGKAIQPIDYTWKAAADQNADYAYGSTTCRIVNQYYPTGEASPVPTTLTVAPRSLMVYAADENGNYPVNVKKTNDELDGYEISYHITSDYVNYSVVFVYKNGSQYYECEENNIYKLVIAPKKTYIFNFNKVNTKVYDGVDATISAINRNIITVMEDEITANKANIKFKFTRLDAEGSTYITDGNGTKYKLIDDEDISSVGTLLVTAHYSDNYTLVFDKGVYTGNGNTDETIGVYTITKKTVNMNVYSNMGSVFTKEYDYYGITSSETINYTGDFNDISYCQKGNAVVDDYSTILYALDLKYYNEELTTTNIKSATAINPYEYNKAGVTSGFDIGYYWFNIRGVFEYEGEKIKFATINESYSNWLAWNYTYKVDDMDAVRYDCDGIYHIKERQVYMIINPEEDANGVIQQGLYNVPIFDNSEYVYEWSYDGTEYTSNMLTEDINTIGGNFGYGLYVRAYDESIKGEVFVNISKYTTIGNVPVGNTFDYTAQFTFHEGSLYDESNNPLGIDYQDVFTVNSNFELINTSTSMKIIALVLNVEIKLSNTLLDGKSEITFNDTNTEKVLVYEVNPLDVYPDSPDIRLTTKENIIEMVNNRDGRLYVTSEDKERQISYSFRNDGEIVNGFYVDSPNRFYGHAAGVYSISGYSLGLDSKKYYINVVSVPFVISPKPIKVTGITRTYFDKQFENYKFTYEGDNDTVINSILHEINFSIYDNTNVDAVVGSYKDNGDYYVAILKENFVSINSSYVVELGTNFVPTGADTTAYVYIPLTINKAIVGVGVTIAGDIEYGDLITAPKYNNCYSVVYDGFPQLLSTYEYTYVNSRTNEINIDTYTSDAQSIQNDLRAIVEGSLIKKDDIVELIASTDYNVQLAKAALQLYVTELNPSFDNYAINWKVISYKIIKKLVDLEINANVSYHKDLSGAITGNFSALWSEKDSLFYNPISDEKLSYNINVSNFALKETSYTTLEEQIKIIFNLSLNESGKYVSSTGMVYDNIDEFLANTLDYIIVDNAYGSDESTSIGLRYIKITGLNSNNFRFNYIAKPIMLYPEIETLGEYKTEALQSYVNVISDAEAIADGVSVSETTHEINGLSMYVQFNFKGFAEDGVNQYYDVKTYGEFNTDSYIGMNYVRELKVYYRGKINGESTDLTINVGDYIYAQIVIKETFYANDYDVRVINEIISNIFVIKFMAKSENNVIMDVVKDKYDGGLKSESSEDVESFDEMLNNTTDTYYYNVTDTGINFDGTFDILTVRAKLLSKATANKYSYEIIVYENDYGKLVFGIVGGDSSSYYVKMKYNNYYTRTTHTTARTSEGVQYYTFSQDNSISDGDDISSGEYYILVGNGYKRVYDTVADLSFVYYKKTEANLADGVVLTDEYYVDFSESVISESLVEIFDGANHTVDIQIDTLGEIVNVTEKDVNQELSIDGNNYTFIKHTIAADKQYYLYITVDNIQYVFAYIGGAYQAEYSYEKSIIRSYTVTNDIEAIDGKTYFAFTLASVSSRDEFNTGSYYVWQAESQCYKAKTLYDESLQYYTIEVLNNSQIVDFSNVYELVIDETENENRTSVIPEFFTQNGKTGVSLSNVYAQVTKYSIKDRLLLTATNQNYLASLILWPNSTDTGEQVYVVTETNVDNILENVEKALQKIAFITISNGKVDDNAYNSTPNSDNENNRITYSCTITDHKGTAIAGNITESGMYLLNYLVMYNYGTNYSTTIYANTINLIVTTSCINKVTIYEHMYDGNNMKQSSVSPILAANDKPYNFSANSDTRYYYSNDIGEYSATDIVVDNFSFDGSSSDVWMYLRVSNINMVTLANDLGIDGLYKEVGFALRIKLTNNIVTTTLYVNEYNRDSNNNTISLYSSSRTDIEWHDRINIIKVDYLKFDDVNYVVFRLYQKDVGTNITELIWQQYLKESLFDGIPQAAIDSLVNGIEGGNGGKYMGMAINNASFRLSQFTTGRQNRQGVDFVKYQKTNELYGNATKGKMNTESILSGQNNVFMYSDAYDIPYGFTDDTVQIKFSFPKGQTSFYDGFDFHFVNSTPYIIDKALDKTVISQRSVYLRYTENAMLIGFAKYNEFNYLRYNLSAAIKAKTGTSTLNEYFMDGKEHTITLYIDRTRVYDDVDSNIYLANASDNLKNIAEKLVEYYMIFIKIDDLAEEYAVCPYLNNLSNLGEDPEMSSNGRDKYFINGLSYIGITLHSDTTELKIHDIVTFNS